MCLSFLGQIIFGAVMLVAFGLTVASMFTPGWTDFKREAGEAANDLEHFKIPDSNGLLPFFCTAPSSDSNNNKMQTIQKDVFNADYCKDWWENMPGWEKAVVACMCLALITEILAIVWTIITICACCCKQFLIHPLPFLAILNTIFLLIAVIIFGIKNKDSIDRLKLNDQLLKSVKDQSEMGYSFYLAIGATVAAAVDIIVGSLTVTLAKRCI